MGLTVLFDTIHGSHCTISAYFYLYLQYFQKKFSVFISIIYILIRGESLPLIPKKKWNKIKPTARWQKQTKKKKTSSTNKQKKKKIEKHNSSKQTETDDQERKKITDT